MVMRILFVAMSDSIHSARWIGQIAEQVWDIHLFPSTGMAIHPALKNVTLHDFAVRPWRLPSGVHLAERAWLWPFPRGRGLAARVLRQRPIAPSWANFAELERYAVQCGVRLAKVIRQVKPDIVHSLEIQHAGYIALKARQHLDIFPTWIVTNWGSDIFYFGRFPEHAAMIRSVLAACDYYSCECSRDVRLGREFGFNGQVLPVLPNTGGLDLEWIGQFRQPGPTSARQWILLKGPQGWVYRAMVGLRALEQCADALQGYSIGIYLAPPEVRRAAALMSKRTGIPVRIIPHTSHEEILRWHGRARVSIGLSISDAISTSFLEAIAMGSFPIQSCTSCADEWMRDGETGALVPPEDTPLVASAIRRALTDDVLVDRAAEQNAEIISKRLDYRKIQLQVIQMYERVAEVTRCRQGGL